MRILIPLHGYVKWNGGLDLIRLLSTAIDVYTRDSSIDVEISFAVPKERISTTAFFSALRYWREMRAGVLGKPGVVEGGAAALRNSAMQIASKHTIYECADGCRGILDALSRSHADVVFPTMLPLGESAVPRVSYLFDFQHRRLPHLFSTRTRRNRDIHFKRLAFDANAVVVNSQDVANDATTFLGLPRSRLLVLPFSPYAKPSWFDIPVEEVVNNYNLTRPYFLISNHFWAHKEHATALYAFAKLLQRAPEIRPLLVMTGDPIDHRDPAHYTRLTKLARNLGISGETRFLGLIPKHDQLALLQGCQALVQPTLFEGGPGGGSVYEAIGLGVPAIVSDIPINREINTGVVRYFSSGDPSSLAEQLLKVLRWERATRDRDALIRAADERLLKLGECIVSCLLNVIQEN